MKSENLSNLTEEEKEQLKHLRRTLKNLEAEIEQLKKEVHVAREDSKRVDRTGVEEARWVDLKLEDLRDRLGRARQRYRLLSNIESQFLGNPRPPMSLT